MSSVPERGVAPRDGESAAADASESVVSSMTQDTGPPGHPDEFFASARSIANDDGRHTLAQAVFTWREKYLEKANFELKLQLQSVEHDLKQKRAEQAATQWSLEEKNKELHLALSDNEKLKALLQKREEHWTSLTEELNKQIDELKAEISELKALLAQQKGLVDKLTSTIWDPRDYAVETATQVLSTLIPDAGWNELTGVVPVQVLWILIQSSIYAEENFAGVMSLTAAVSAVCMNHFTLACVGKPEQETSRLLNELCNMRNEDQMSLQKSLFKLSYTTVDMDTHSKITLPDALCKAFQLGLVDCKQLATPEAACYQLRKKRETYDGARAINVLYTAQVEVVELMRAAQA